MKLSIRRIVGWAIVVLGCCALAFAGLLAMLVWGGCKGGECFIELGILDRELRSTMAISAAIGLAGVVVGMFLVRVRPGPNENLAQKRLP
jgi:hypothetical protein